MNIHLIKQVKIVYLLNYKPHRLAVDLSVYSKHFILKLDLVFNYNIF